MKGIAMAEPEQLSSNWMVIGGAGFFGIHMCAFLAKCGYRVISYDIASFPPHERPEGVEEVVGDIRDTGKLRESLHGVQYVIHAAAALTLSNPAEIEAVNAEGTRLVLTCCADVGVKRLVYIGTTAAYGMPRYHPICEDAPLDPMGPYGTAKAKGEQYCLRTENLETVLIRPKSFIGPGRLGIFQILFDWIESGKRIYVLGDGNNRFQLLEVEDLCEAVHKAMLRGRNREIYNLGAAQFGTVNED